MARVFVPLCPELSMNKLHDPELEAFKRNVDLAQYAEKAGYERRERDGARGLTVLEHQNGDRIVVARSPLGQWIYASVPDYAPRGAGEPEADALSRLRQSIQRSGDKGSIVEFVQQRDPRTIEREVPLETVRARLRSYGLVGLPLDFEGAIAPPPYPRGRERSVVPPAPPPAGENREPRRPGAPDPELNLRRYDWDPRPAGAPQETEVEQRLRRWREAQTAVEVKVHGTAVSRTLPAAAALTAPPKTIERPAIPPSPAKSELNRRRLDGSPPLNVDALIRAARNRSPDRGR
jgi:hypothetical protein